MDDLDGVRWEDPPLSKLGGPYQDCRNIHPDAYIKYHEIQVNVTSHTECSLETKKKRNALTHIILCLLFTVPYEDRFFFNNVPRILENSAEDEGDFDVEKAEKAFQELERYILLMAQSPWKPELRQIKLYNGFFKVKVEARLSRAVDVLAILGFQKTSSDWLQMSSPVNVDLCHKVAFDMFVASVECKLLSTAFRRLVPIGFKPVDIVKGRRYVQGNVQDLEIWLEQNCKPVSRHPVTNSLEYAETVDSIVELPVRQHKLHVGEISGGRAYNKDIMRVSNTPDTRLSRSRKTDSGYLTEAGSSLRSRAERIAPFRMTPDNYDTPRCQSANWFEEGTLDDHLAAASLMTQTSEPAKPGLKATLSLGEYEPRAGAEWKYVRDGLLKRYGKGYFQGERGDILADNKRRVSSFDEKLHGGVDIEALEAERNEAPTLPPRDGKIAAKAGKTNFTGRLESRSPVYPPPLVARGSKPGFNHLTTDECDTVEDNINSNRLGVSKPRLKSSLAVPMDEKSAFFKDKLQDYERLNQELSFPKEFPDLDHKPSMQSETTWSCESCTYQNETSEHICGVCGAKNSQKNPATRVCSQCTLENQPTAKFCEACGKCLDSFETEV